MEDMWDIKRLLESQGNMHNKVEIHFNLELWSLARSPRPPCLQIDA
jgi:hypothetical protein